MSSESVAQPSPAVDPPKDLSASARGWHTIQLAVLGFIGICGVLRTDSSPAPRTVQLVAAGLAVAALAIGCLAIFTVARIAYPLTHAAGNASSQRSITGATAQLRTGILLTVVALVLAVLAALSGWWPTGGTAAATTAVAVTGATGQSWCGPLVAGPAGTVSIRTRNGIVSVPTQAIAQFRPVAQCP